MKKSSKNIGRRFVDTTRLGSLAAVLAVSGSTLLADTLYWNGGDGVWMSGTGDALWSDSAVSGAGTLGWTDYDNAVITSANSTLSIGKAANDAVYVGDLAIQNGLTLKQGVNGSSTKIYLTGAVSGDLTLDPTALQLHTYLQSASAAFNGKLEIKGSAWNHSYVYFQSAAAVGISTKVVNNGNLILGTSPASAVTYTIGELSGTRADAQIVNQNSGTGTTLRIEQDTDTTYAGKIGSASNNQWNISLVKAGTGTLVLSGNVSHAGTTTVESGALYFDGAASARNTLNGVAVRSGATLGGKGLIGIGGGATRNVVIDNGGIIAPGGVDEIGTLTINGTTAITSAGLIFSGNATLQVRLAALGDNDKIVLTNFGTNGGKGSASGGDGSILFDFINYNGLAELGAYDLISFASTPGIVLSTFGLTQASIDAGWAGSFGYDGNTLQFTVTGIGAAIPEPATYAAILGGVALGGVIYIRRRRI